MEFKMLPMYFLVRNGMVFDPFYVGSEFVLGVTEEAGFDNLGQIRWESVAMTFGFMGFDLHCTLLWSENDRKGSAFKK